MAASTFSYTGGKAKGKDALEREPDAMNKAWDISEHNVAMVRP